MFAFLNKYRDFGLLLLRVGLGGMFIWHGLPKLLAGPDLWQKLGGAMGTVGISSVPVFWGLAAVVTETVGGALLILGLFFRPACILLTITMAVAASMHLQKGDGLKVASHAIEDGIVFLSLIFIGPGKYSIDKK